jgi:SSS family solute:Na+ symporter
MNPLDYLVLFGSMLGIAAFGLWKSRGQRGLSAYLKGSGTTGWLTIGLSVMATQASAITFLSTPGQGYEDGLGFVQNYLAMPLALIIVAAVFLPMFRRLNVFTAYEFLGRRFDSKTRLLGAGLFLLQRGLGAGITIYAPAIVLSTVFGWPLGLTIVFSGLLVIIYTVAGGNEAVTVTQKYQIMVIFGGMVTAFVVLLARLSSHLTFLDSLSLAGTFHKLKAVDFSPDLRRRYTFWSGMFGGLCLMLSYFGTDQSQVQRYLSGASLRERAAGADVQRRLQNPDAVSAFLMLGVLIFVFYQFEPAPVFLQSGRAASCWWRRGATRRPENATEGAFKNSPPALRAKGAIRVRKTGSHARHRRRPGRGGTRVCARARPRPYARPKRSKSAPERRTSKCATPMSMPQTGNDGGLRVHHLHPRNNLPHGVIGLLVAAFFAAARSPPRRRNSMP